MARSRTGACRLLRGNLLGRYLVGAEGPVGGGALDRPLLSRHPELRRSPAGPAPHRTADHQPHHRHHQEHRARHGDRGRRDPQSGHHRAIVLRQRHPAHDGGRRLRDPVHSGRCARPLPRDPIRLAEGMMEAIGQQSFNLAIMERALPLLLMGLRQTVLLCLIVIPLGLAGGLSFALLSRSALRPVRWAAVVGIDFFRAVPPLVLLIFVYSGLPFAGLRPSPFAAVAVAFFLNTSSYYGEIYRAGIESVGQGQWDAARSSGLKSYQTLAYVV